MRQDQAVEHAPRLRTVSMEHISAGNCCLKGLSFTPHGASRQAPAEMNDRILFACQTGFVNVPLTSVRYCDASMIP